jgi:M6 family metalloprotease-like protein
MVRVRQARAARARFGVVLLAALTALTLGSGVSHAGPGIPGVVSLSQPDGSRLRARIRGDEFQNWVEAADTGHTVVFDKARRQWEYAERDAEGALRGTGARATDDGRNVPRSLKPGVRPNRDTTLEAGHERMIRRPRIGAGSQVLGSDGVLEGQSGGAAAGPVDTLPDLGVISGSRKLLIVLINFSNRQLTTTAANWNSTIFSTTSGAKSVVNYFSQNSFGQLTVDPATHTQQGNPQGIVTVTVSNAHPDSGGTFNYTVESGILNNALAQAATYVDFPSFDTNSNGTLEQSELSIYFVYAGYEASGSGLHPSIWAHAWSGNNVTAGGRYVTRWALNGELNNAGAQHPMGVIVHELGHALCGLPDLYDTSYTNAGLGQFSLMAGGSWGFDSGEYSGTTPVALDAWSREFLGWTTPSTPAVAGTITLAGSLAAANNAVKLVNSSVATAEYWLVENRTMTTGWDRGLRGLIGASSGGVLVLHVDNTASINRYTAGGHQGVMVEQASTTGCNMATSTCRGTIASLFAAGGNAKFGLTTNPAARYYSGQVGDMEISNVSAPGASVTFDLVPGVTAALAGDARPDLLWRNTFTGEVCLWYLDGATMVQYAYSLTAGAAWSIVTTGDFDGDGSADILWRNPSTGQICVWFMHGAVVTGYALGSSAAPPWVIAGVGDFDGDGKADILWRNGTSGQVCLWFMNGATMTRYAFAPPAATTWSVVGVGDFDGDGKLDTLWQNPTSGQVCVWFMDGAAVLRYTLAPSAGPGWSVAAVHDMDGDGSLDIIWRNGGSGQVCLWFMDGATLLRYAFAPSAATAWTFGGVGNFDGDGKPDFLWRNVTTGQDCIWFMDGATMLRYAFAPSAGSNWSLAGIVR